MFRVPASKVVEWQSKIPLTDRTLTQKDCVCERHFALCHIMRAINTEAYWVTDVSGYIAVIGCVFLAMTSSQQRINDLLVRIRQEGSPPMTSQSRITGNGGLTAHANRPNLQLGLGSGGSSPVMARPHNLSFTPRRNDNVETESKLKEIMKISGDLTIDSKLYKTDIKDMEDIEELGNGTCGHVVKMRHKPSGKIIAVKQMRRSGNSEENKRIIMDIEVVLKSHDCKYIVQCLGCFISESEVWICMELMDSCFDKLLKRLKQPVPEHVLGKVTVATVEALSYLKDKHGVIHRDVKPSNILFDMLGNVKLCDFGISGRLVDSMAKTRSAGCAAYMAPERIEPDPQNPDYDVRADVWSLGITLVELATGVFPYQDCKTDFEVLTRVIAQEPPSLPNDKEFSPEFRDFVKHCLIKDKKHRPKYNKLKNHDFIKKYESAHVNVRDWFVTAMQQADAVANRAAPRHNSTVNNSIRHFFTSQQRQPPRSPAQKVPNAMNGTQSHYAPVQSSSHAGKTTETNAHHFKPIQSEGWSSGHNSRLSAFQATNQREDFPHHQSTHQPNTRCFSPYEAYQNHGTSKKVEHFNSHIPHGDAPEENRYQSPILQRRLNESPINIVTSPYQQRRVASETRWRSPSASPVPLRSDFRSDEQQYGNTSPIILQRFYHQQKQQQLAKEAEESGKKRFASYIKLQLSGDRSGRSSRHQSPEPPPRLSRNNSGDSQSPLALRRNLLESYTPSSPALSRRYISPTPPVPPPRRLSESTSVPGSPQHLRARFHYTPEPQRRLFQNNDIS